MDSKKEMETKQNALAEIKAELEKAVSTWSDLYSVFHQKMNAFHTSPSQMTMEDAMLTMYAFILTLEEMPEEGDALVIAKRTVEIMIMEPERLGASVTVIDQEDAERAGRVLRAMQAMMSGDMPIPPESDTEADETPTVPKKHLH